MSYPKKNFTIKMYSDESRETKLKKAFKDWGYESNKYVLKANWIDHSHARNIVCANLWDEAVSSRSDYASLPEEMRNSPRNGAIDGFPIKVYTNGTYQGIYTWNIGKDDWMWGMDEDNSNHVLLCGETNTDGVYAENACNFRALWSGTDGEHWSVEVGTNSDAVKNGLNALISCVMDTDDTTFKATIGNYLDVQSAIDYYIHQYVIDGIDGLAKNMLLATYDGTKWICGAYDMDSTFGLYTAGDLMSGATGRCPEDYQEQFSLLWERISSLYEDEIIERYAELRKTVYSFANIATKFERFMDAIGLDLLEEDLTIYTGIPSGDTNNIQYIRNFVRDRLAYVDTKLGTLEYLYKLPAPMTFDGVDDYLLVSCPLFDKARNFTLFIHFDADEQNTTNNEPALLATENTTDLIITHGGNQYWRLSASGKEQSIEDTVTGNWAHTWQSVSMIVAVFVDGVFNFGKYYHKDSGEIRYINKVNGSAFTESTATNIIIGAKEPDSGFWKGTVNDLRIYNRALTEKEVVALINEKNE